MIDRVVILDASMDVWSMAIVLMQAITRLTMGPTEGDVRHTTAHVVSLDGSWKRVKSTAEMVGNYSNTDMIVEACI